MINLKRHRLCCRCKKECEPRLFYTVNIVVTADNKKTVYDLCDKCTRDLEMLIFKGDEMSISACPACKSNDFNDIFRKVVGGYKIAHLCKFRAIQCSTVFKTKKDAIEKWNNHIEEERKKIEAVLPPTSYIKIHNIKYEIDDTIINENGIYKVFAVLQDDTVSRNERICKALTLFYKDINTKDDIVNVFGENVNEAIKQMYRYFELIMDKEYNTGDYENMS